VLIYHGWADSLIPARGTPDHYEAIAAANGGFEKTQGFARLFMAPGVAHCRGGVGPDQFDMLTALENWVERGQAPATVLATRPAKPGLPALSRPLCPYPAAARYTGRGDPNDAANFTCQAKGA
jgi:feruloyl esterase